jgi:hypothetical protein
MKITERFPIPNTVNLVSEQFQVGSYTLGFNQTDGSNDINDNIHLVIIGTKVVDISRQPITYTSIIPADKTWIDEYIINHPFELEDKVMYHVVSYNGNAWIFSSFNIALNLVMILNDFKSVALEKKLNAEKSIVVVSKD